MKLFSYESKKLMGNRFLYGLLVVFLCLNALVLLTAGENGAFFLAPEEAEAFINEYALQPEKMDAEYQSILEWDESQELRWQEEMMKGNFYWEAESKPPLYAKEGYTDRQYFEWLFDWLDRENNYRTRIDTVIANANKNIRELESKNVGHDDYAWKYQQRVIDVYSSLKERILFSNELQHGWEQYFGNETVNVFITLSVIVTASFVCMKERSDGTVFLIHPTKRGRTPVLTSKIIVLILWVGAIVLLFSLESLLLIGGCFGFSSPLAYVQEISDYIYCPYALRIWQYLLITLMLKWLVFSTFAMLIFLIGIVLPDYALIAVSGLAIVGINAFLNLHRYVQPDSVLQNVNLQAVSFGSSLFVRYKGVNLVGNVVGMITFVICFYLLLLCIMICVLFVLYNSKLPVSCGKSLFEKLTTHLPRLASVRRNTVPHGGLFAAELYKCIGSPLLLSIMMVVLLFDAYLYKESIIPPTSYAEKVYHEYMTILAGTLTEEKMSYLSEERMRIDSILEVSGEKKEAYLAGKISVSDYTDYLIELYNADARDEILAEVESNSEYLLKCQSEEKEAWFVYDTGWKALFNAPFDWGLYAVLLLLSANVFPVEFGGKVSESDAACIIRSTRRGRTPVWLSKYAALGLVVFSTGVAFTVVRYLILSETYEFPLYNAPIASLRFLENLPLSMSLWQFTACVYLVRMFAVCILAYFCCAVSSLVRKQIPAILITTVFSLLPTVAAYFEVEILYQYEYISLFLAVPLILSGKAVRVISVTFVGLLICSLISAGYWLHDRYALINMKKAG